MIEPRYGVLQTLFADRVFRIPHYQRFYSWRTRQRDDLFGDIRKLAKDKSDRHHFMATIVCHRTAETKSVGAALYRVFDVVDGQQRLTTLILLLKCIELALPTESEDRAELAKTLVKRDGHIILLQTNNANEVNFNRFIREGDEPSKSDIITHADRNLANAIRECRSFVKEWTDGDAILGLMRMILHRLGFVVYDTEDSQAVYTVFEVLNSRGLAVDWLDKTKSALMGRAFELASSNAAAEAEMQSLQSLWGQIYGAIAKEDVPGDEILRITATLHYGSGQGRPLSAEDALDAIRRAAATFDKPRAISGQLLDVARKLVELSENAHLGPVTKILHARLLAVALNSAKGVSEPERERILEQWERVTFRIFGLHWNDSRVKVGDYVRLAIKVAQGDLELRTFNQIMSALRVLGAEYSIDAALKEGLVGKNFYERADECRYVLWCYEEYLAVASGVKVDEQLRAIIWARQPAATIEHIIPQWPHGTTWIERLKGAPVEPNVHRVGNLLLLPMEQNAGAGRLPFERKKEIYSKFNSKMAREVCKSSDWTLNEIDEREKRIVEWARSRWGDL